MEAAISSRFAATLLVAVVCVVSSVRGHDRTPVRTVTELVSVVNYTPRQAAPPESPQLPVLALADVPPVPGVPAQADKANEVMTAVAGASALPAASPQTGLVVMAAAHPVPPPRASLRSHGAQQAKAAHGARAPRTRVLASACTGAECARVPPQGAHTGARKPLGVPVIASGEVKPAGVPRLLVPLRNFGLYLKQTFDPERRQTVAGGS